MSFTDCSWTAEHHRGARQRPRHALDSVPWSVRVVGPDAPTVAAGPGSTRLELAV